MPENLIKITMTVELTYIILNFSFKCIFTGFREEGTGRGGERQRDRQRHITWLPPAQPSIGIEPKTGHVP